MIRRLLCLQIALGALAMAGVASSRAAERFELPACAGDFGTEVVLNAPLLEAMIEQAEPGGEQPDQQHEALFIRAKYYLERIDGLLLVSRAEPAQHPLVLTKTCAPYPEAPTHIRSYFAALTETQNRAFIAYHDLVLPPAQRAPAHPGTVARIPATADQQDTGQSSVGSFAIDIYEVTNAQYREFLKAGGYTTKTYWSEAGWQWVQEKQRQQPSYWQDEQLNGDNQPVVGVTWYEADAYCHWAGKALPTEPQWDLACRGNDGRTYPWGNEPLPAPAPDQTTQQSEFPSQSPEFKGPKPVGSAPDRQSPYGVQDMAGNVLEWTRTMRDGNQRVLCGGSGDDPERVGCGVRSTLLPGIAANFIGFRCLSETP
jgi:formylglycine-generating enzyme required for sulfatase activity